MMRVCVKVEYAKCSWNCYIIRYAIGPHNVCYKIGQFYVDLVDIGKCRHMVQVLSHSQGWLCSHEVSVE